MQTRTSDITTILDRSGSMGAVREATVRGVNDFIDEVRKEPGEGFWSLVQFDDPGSAQGAGEEFPQVVFDHLSDRGVPRLELNDYQPRGGTALVDAVCRTVLRVKDRVLPLPPAERPRVLVVIMTDGYNNDPCQTYTVGDMRAILAEAEAKWGFRFIYLGANQDAFAESEKLGVRTRGLGAGGQHCNKVNYVASAAGVGVGLNAAANVTRAWKADGNDTASSLQGDGAPDVKVEVKVETK